MSSIHVISVSGGKDSTATLLLAIARVGRDAIRPIFCDTGNEHEAVYSYLDYLESALSVRIHRLRADFSADFARKRMFIARDQRTRRGPDGRRVRWTNKSKRRALALLHPTGNPFLDLCMLKGRFPSRKAQFCTQELKRNPAVEYQLDLMEQGHRVISWQGVRRDESLNRRNAKKTERIGKGLHTFRPIVDWTADGVFAHCAAAGIQPNPLYLQGMTRVGCMPCINVNKAELREIAARFPEHVARIAEWEILVSSVSKRQAATFIPAPGISPAQAKEHTIHHVVRWAKTTHGGRQFDLLADITETRACASAYGLCE
ncbi:3'-phosphoadenosine 5'-phosphosulfate sulfotransferase (PAPS reductase)/FAD synthetase [Comamonas sp. BIGb0124]|uniref:phosphoadenosine phosphosulfate reductase domain-containing protein n=1 Tax=Comamonas sp. BIGb0124 TaxID=2485130 RepID=UPI000F484759|nr:phosphoadenosine phosphosulfate reductase family protein [Comamonas sp. BIGb0124]ROR23014.1 3'-phosphoadenosine 5'-phosphosulfate sulfotransferase (PAPS reductase)/FAD synthetase [Comamonas sp. BIGb0124]